MQAISSSQQSLMHRLLTQGGSVSTPASSSRSAIEDIANRLHKQQNGNGMSSYQDDGYSSTMNEVSVSNNSPSMNLTCDDCGIVKSSTEEMEIHIKTEHLNWLPFQCPICLTTRASDAQMREHLHSTHKKTMNKFIYIDDMNSKRQLQGMMDRAIHSSATRKMTGFPASNPSITPDSGYLSINQDNEKVERVASADLTESPPAEPSPGFTANVVKQKRSPKFELQSTGDTNTDALLASISRAANGESESNMEDSLASIFFNGYKMKMDEDQEDGLDTENDDSMLENLVNPISVLDDVAALFSNGTTDRSDEHASATSDKKGNPKILGNQVSKKRVLGECSKCNKPVTAGARQMHMFFHLAKDHKTYRFRCLFDGCNVEHYRKDQMENHQSKIHGKIDPDMMEDRSLELFSRCQELNHELFVANRSMITHHQAQDLSMELLGTKNGSTPGPTAEKATLAYHQQNAQKEKDKKLNGSKEPVIRMAPDEEHPLECRLCHKTMQNRIRGFHILWHLAKDMGIMRYICKFCGFSHDRSQSVQTHGKKEHQAEDVVLDKIKEYEAEVNMMSEKCFGFQSSFSQDNKRRSKIPVIVPTSSSKPKKRKLEDGSEDAAECDSEEGKSREETPEFEHEEEDESAGLDQSHAIQKPLTKGSKPSRKRKPIRSARFGTRRPTSKSKRIEMLRLREISMLIGGAQYYKKKATESCICEKCGKVTNSRLTEHAYTHVAENLFACSLCEFGNQTRDVVVKHMSDKHPAAGEKPVDNRLKYAKEIKESIRDCYSTIFVDAPIPTKADIDKLRSGAGNQIAGADEQESDDHAEEEAAHSEEDEKEGILEMDEDMEDGDEII